MQKRLFVEAPGDRYREHTREFKWIHRRSRTHWSQKVKKLASANLLLSKVQDALVLSRFQAIVEMDVPSSYFFGLERKSGQERRVIHTLLSYTGQEIVQPSQIRTRGVVWYLTSTAVSMRRTLCWRGSAVDSGLCGDQLLSWRAVTNAGTKCCPGGHAGAVGSRHRWPHSQVFFSNNSCLAPSPLRAAERSWQKKVINQT